MLIGRCRALVNSVQPRIGRIAAQLRDYVGKGRPLIVAWRVGRDRFHDVVVVGFDEEVVVVHDPAEGAARRVAARVFEERWAGASHWTLLVMPAP